MIQQIAILILIIAGNAFSAYFWIWLYKELFHKDISIIELVKQGLLSALAALSIIRLSGIYQLLSKVIVEEASKVGSSEIANTHAIASDHIATAILSGIGFAVIENIIYLFYLSQSSLVEVSFIRIITNSILHALFTGIIGYGIFQAYSNTGYIKKIINLCIYTIIGIGAHVAYNRSLQQSYVAFAFVFVIIGYFGLSFLLYKSDRLYIS